MSQEEQIAAKLKQIFVNPKITSAIVADVLDDRPKGWSRKSMCPYYKAKYALQLKEELEHMIATRTDLCYSYEDWQKMSGLGKDSLYLRVNQSRRYLLERLDPDKKYAKFFEMVTVTRERGKGVMISFLPEFRDGDVSSFKPRSVIPEKETPIWREKIDEFLENEDNVGESLHVGNLALSPEDIVQLKLEMHGLANIVANISTFDIKLVKINVE